MESELGTLQKMLQELVTEWGGRLKAVSQCEDDFEPAKDNLQRARDQERAAVQADEDLKAKIKALREYLGGQIDKCEAARVEKLDRLGARQVQTYRERWYFSEIAHKGQIELGRFAVRLAIAKDDLKTTEKNLQVKIRQVCGYLARHEAPPGRSDDPPLKSKEATRHSEI